MSTGSLTDQDRKEPEKSAVEEKRRDSIENQDDAAVPPLQDRPPDGGFVAWLQIFSSFFILVNTWGIVNTYGAFQTYYETGLLNNKSPSAISWIGSMQGFLLLFVGFLTGPIFDAGYLKTLLLVGSFLIVFGLMMTSLATEYYQIFLAQGIAIGLGAGCLFVPSVAVLSTYFVKRRAMAIGLSASGSSVGGLIYPIVFHRLVPQVGFPWATRTLGFISFGTLAISYITIRRRVSPPAKRKLFDWTALREAPFMLFTLGNFFVFTGVYIPFYFISAYALKKTGASDDRAFYLVPILNAASIFGRIIPNIIADKTGSLNALIPCAFICSILAYSWISIHTNGGLLVFAILYGFFSGTMVSLSPSVLVGLSPDPKFVGTRVGMSFSIAGLGILIGNPVAGALLNIGEGKFVHAQVFGATITMAGAICIVASRVAKVGYSLRVKA
ncbi:putative MFS monocarboxylate transporter [Auriscalpium vulgare]|uniref:MFS monocarboxylate transporter n=1 Tax=Auriscalpium vulgare TaxID=40419 RepID=A0ACB8RLM5_9AGAM|nr:putative MFS monocarboxylate transporter [Auriscalpium vulgare]